MCIETPLDISGEASVKGGIVRKIGANRDLIIDGVSQASQDADIVYLWIAVIII